MEQGNGWQKSAEEQALVGKLRELQTLPKDAKNKRLEEILDKTLGGKGEFQRSYCLCSMGSKDELHGGYHLAYVKEGKPPINPEIIPIAEAKEIFHQLNVLCDRHAMAYALGFWSGAMARNKPYEVLSFSPSQELRDIVKREIQGYRMFSSEKPAGSYLTPGKNQNLATAVIFEDEKAYASPAEREGAVNRLQEAEKAVQLYKEGRMSKEGLDAAIRKQLQIEKPEAQLLPVTAEITPEAQLLPVTAEPQPVKEEETEATYILKNPANFEYIANMLMTFNQPYHLKLIEGEKASVKVSLSQAGQIGIKEAVRRVGVLDTLLEYKGAKKLKEVVNEIHTEFGMPLNS